MIRDWFPTPIYMTFLDLDNSKMIERSYKIKDEIDKNGTLVQFYSNTFTSHYNKPIEHYSEFHELLDLVEEHVKVFARSHLVPEDVSYTHSSWINIGAPGNYQELHTHGGAHFSAVYYLKVPENSGQIMFRSPTCFLDMLPLPKINDMENEHTYKTCTYKSQENMLLIFRSYLTHQVNVNNSNEDRISVAMNFKCESKNDGYRTN